MADWAGCGRSGDSVNLVVAVLGKVCIWNWSSHLCPESSLDEFAWDFECGHECAALRNERFSRTGFIFFECFSCEGKLLEDCEGVHVGCRGNFGYRYNVLCKRRLIKYLRGIG